MISLLLLQLMIVQMGTCSLVKFPLFQARPLLDRRTLKSVATKGTYVDSLPFPQSIVSNNGTYEARNFSESSMHSLPTRIGKALLTAAGFTTKKRVLILMSDTGGGHRASAQAIDQALLDIYPGKVEVSIMDIWTDHAKYPFNQFVPAYRFLAKYPVLWRAFYLYGQFPPTKYFTENWSKMSSYSAFSEAITSVNPDLVVSVHPLCQLMPISIVSELNSNRGTPKKPKIPFVTVVTDLGGAHTTWVCNLFSL
jgi:1,2-diacylglycerol 3-beta-galactosyltransferase